MQSRMRAGYLSVLATRQRFGKKIIEAPRSHHAAPCVQVLADYSQSQYNEKWSQGVWWDRQVILYGDADVEKTNPVLQYLVGEGRTRAVFTVTGGCACAATRDCDT